MSKSWLPSLNISAYFRNLLIRNVKKGGELLLNEARVAAEKTIKELANAKLNNGNYLTVSVISTSYSPIMTTWKGKRHQDLQKKYRSMKALAEWPHKSGLIPAMKGKQYLSAVYMAAWLVDYFKVTKSQVNHFAKSFDSAAEMLKYDVLIQAFNLEELQLLSNWVDYIAKSVTKEDFPAGTTEVSNFITFVRASEADKAVQFAFLIVSYEVKKKTFSVHAFLNGLQAGVVTVQMPLGKLLQMVEKSPDAFSDADLKIHMNEVKLMLQDDPTNDVEVIQGDLDKAANTIYIDYANGFIYLILPFLLFVLLIYWFWSSTRRGQEL